MTLEQMATLAEILGLALVIASLGHYDAGEYQRQVKAVVGH